jgi:hypothetical protein
MYQPALWHDYFVVVGGRRGSIDWLTAVFIRCALVLMGWQNGQAIAVELIAVLLVVKAILYSSIRQDGDRRPAAASRRRDATSRRDWLGGLTHPTNLRPGRGPGL